jgi:fibronectin-binding autotransporter adhesin
MRFAPKRGTAPRLTKSFRRLLAATLATASVNAAARAAPYTWDIFPGTVGPGDGAVTGGTGAWDLAAGNWTIDGGVNNVPWDNANGTANSAIFGGTAGTVTIGAAIAANALTFNVAGYTVAATAGNGLTLGGTTPAILVASGAGATILSTGVTYSTAATVTNSSAGLLTLSGAQTLTAAATFGGTGNITISGAIGAGTFTKSGAGTLTLTNAGNTFNNITVSGGTLGVSAQGTLGASGNTVTLNNSSTIKFNAAYSSTTTLHVLSVAASATATLDVGTGLTATVLGNQLIGATGTLNKVGLGTLSVGTSGTATIGTININGGVLLNASQRLGSVGAMNVNTLGQFRINDDGTATFNIVSGGILKLNGVGPAGSTLPGAFILTDQTATAGTAPTTTWSNATTLQTDSTIGVYNTSPDISTLILSGALTGTGNLTKAGNGVLILSNAGNTFGNATTPTVTVLAGILQISGGNNRIPVASALTLVGDATSSAPAVLELNALSQTLAGLTSTGSPALANRVINTPAGDGALVVNYSGAGQTYAGNLGAAGGNNFTFTKAGTGTLTLTGTNTYSRATTVSGGTLVIGAAFAFSPNTPAVTVAGGAVLDVSAVAGGVSFAATQSLTAGRTTTPANDVVGSITTAGTVNVGGTGTVATATISGDLTLTGANVAFDLSNTAAGANDAIRVGGNLTLSGTTNINVNLTQGGLETNTYTLMTYGGTLTGGSANLNLTGLGGGTTRQSFATSTSVPGVVTLNVTGSPANLTWVGNGANNVWDLVSTPNFAGGTGGDNRFYNLDTVTFDGTGVGGATLVAVTGALQPGSVVVTGGQDYTLGGTGSITGTASLTKSGTGTLTLANANTYTGGTVVNAGSLVLASGSSVTGALAVNGGTVQAMVPAGFTSVSVSGGTFLALNATGSATGTSAVSVTSGGTLQVGGGGTDGSVSGAITLNNGSLVLNHSGAVTYANAVTVAGPGTISNAGAGDATFSATTPVGTNTLKLSGTGNTIFSGIVSGAATGNIVKDGAGSVNFRPANTTTTGFNGTVTLNGGTFILGDGAAGGDLFATSIVVNAGATFQFGLGTVDTDNPDMPNTTFVTVNPGGTVDWRIGETFGGVNLLGGTIVTTGVGTNVGNLDTTAVTVAGPQSWTSGTVNGAGTLQSTVGGDRVIEKTTGGVVTVMGQVSLSSTANVRDGKLVLAALANLGTSPINLGGPTTTGTLEYGGVTASRTPAMTLDVGGGVISITGGGSNLTLSGLLSGPGNLTKTGDGTLSLTGANTYAGGTTINGGTLLANAAAPNSATGTAAVTVNATGTLGGTGSIAGPVTINAAGRLSPGASVGKLTTGAETWNAGGTYNWEIGDPAGAAGGTGWDLVETNAAVLTIGATPGAGNRFTINIVRAGGAATSGPIDPDLWFTIAHAGSVTGFSPDAFTLPDSALGEPWEIRQVPNGSGGFDIQVGTVPEPGTTSLLALGTLGLLRRRRRSAVAC